MVTLEPHPQGRQGCFLLNHTNLSHCFKDALLVTVHFCKRPYLGKIDGLTVTEGNDLIKSENKIKGILSNISLFKRLTIFRNLQNTIIVNVSFLKIIIIITIIVSLLMYWGFGLIILTH